VGTIVSDHQRLCRVGGSRMVSGAKLMQMDSSLKPTPRFRRGSVRTCPARCGSFFSRWPPLLGA
jgi:hypothetical protein